MTQWWGWLAYSGVAPLGQPPSLTVATSTYEMRQKMRLNMSCYMFDTGEASLFGVNEAIILHHLKFWVIKNAANGKNLHDGHHWTYNSYAAFEAIFPFWNKQQIGRLLRTLIDKGVVIRGNFNAKAYDKTSWYTVADAFLSDECGSEVNRPVSKMNQGCIKSDAPIPDGKPDSKQQIDTHRVDELKIGSEDKPEALREPVGETRLPSQSGEETGASATNQGNLDTPPPAAVPPSPYTPQFDAFWLAYPSRPNDSKRNAFKAWKQMLKETNSPTIMKSLAGYTFSKEKQYIPHAATWLRAAHWESTADEHIAAAKESWRDNL